jgi:hypothetical protein
MLQRIGRGSGAGGFHQPRSKVQRLGRILPATPRCVLVAPYYSQGSRMNPTIGQDKKEAAQSFTEWWEKLPHTDLTIFSDGSEQYYKGEHSVIYGYAIYISQVKIASGQGSLHHQSLVFDAEAVGAWRRLQHTISLTASYPFNRIWMCIDSTLVIWGTRGTALASSQWAFLACQGAMKTTQHTSTLVTWAHWDHREWRGRPPSECGGKGPFTTNQTSLPAYSIRHTHYSKGPA